MSDILDNVAKALASGVHRRQALRRLAGGAAAFLPFGAAGADARTRLRLHDGQPVPCQPSGLLSIGHGRPVERHVLSGCGRLHADRPEWNDGRMPRVTAPRLS